MQLRGVMGEDDTEVERDRMIVVMLMASRRVGETLYEVADRVVTCEAHRMSGGSHAAAARLVGVSARVMNYKAANYQLRGIDEEVGMGRYPDKIDCLQEMP